MTIQVSLRAQRGAFTLDAAFAASTSGITALSGRSGAGKTTILRAIAGLERLSGRVAVDGEIWQDDKHFIPPHRRHAGMVFSGANLLPHLSVSGNLRFAERAGGGNAAQAIAATRIEPLLDHRPDQLSAGEAQRVAIARAIAAAPRLLLLDEPLSGLDERSRSEMIEVLVEVLQQARLPAIYVSHRAEEIARLANRILVLEGGRIVDA